MKEEVMESINEINAPSEYEAQIVDDKIEVEILAEDDSDEPDILATN